VLKRQNALFSLDTRAALPLGARHSWLRWEL